MNEIFYFKYAWANEKNSQIYKLMREKKFVNLEIASSKIFGENPYDNLEKVAHWKNNLNFKISSIHSIWYGRTEKFFGTYSKHKFLLSYTKKAVNFA